MNQSLTKNDILILIKQRDKSIAFRKPKKSSKSSSVWKHFFIIVVNDIEQDVPKRIKDKIKLACTEFTAVDCLAFELVTGEGFFKMAQSIFDAGRCFNHLSNVDVKELIPSPITISRNVDRLFEEKKVDLLNLHSSMESYCIICDFWTERFTGLSYCGSVLRHVTKDFKLLHFILGCFLFDSESQSANNIRAFVDSQLLSFGLVLNNTIFVDTDNENKISFLYVYDELAGVINKNLIDSLAAINKDLLEELCIFLELFDQAIIQLSGEDKPTKHQVIPIQQLLINHCEVKYDDSDGFKEMKLFLGERIKSIWIPQDQHYASILLHPSLKHFHIAPHEKSKAYKLVNQELLKHTSIPVVVAATDSKTGTSTTSSTFSTSKPVPTNDLVGRCFDQPQPLVKLANELDDYMALETQLHEIDDVLLFWKENAKKFPVLSSIVRDLFLISASNTSVERLFSSSKNTIADRRTSLAAEKVNKLLFFQKNLFSLAQINEELQMQKQE
ncbi:unnamed protein product [Rotaria sp. Silwood1]|nr:unnamed protein product [Rotaria sp. Silwood1]